MRWGRLGRYALVGALNTTITFAVFSTLVLFGTGYVAALVLGYGAGLLCGFILNRHWTFGVRGHVHKQAPRYAVVQGCGLLANLAVLVLLVELAGVEPILAQGVALLAVLASTYTLNGRWTFAPHLAR